MAEQTIDGETYSVTPLLAKRAIVLQAKLAKVVGPALPLLIEAMASKKDEAAAQRAGVAALNKIAETIDPVSFGDLIEEVVQLAEIKDGGQYRRVIMDQDFTGNLQGILPVVGFVLREQFGDFFTAFMGSGTRKGLKKV